MPAFFQSQSELFACDCRSIDELLGASHEDLRCMLTHRELRESNWWRNPDRRAAYLAGRLLAKKLIQHGLSDRRLAARQIEILSRSKDLRQGEPPRLALRGIPSPLSISIAHSDRYIAVAIARSRLGIDLVEPSGPLSPGFRRLWYHDYEWTSFANQDDSVWWTAWCVKEASYKTVGHIVAYQPRRIRTTPLTTESWSVAIEPLDLSRRVRVHTTQDWILACCVEEPETDSSHRSHLPPWAFHLGEDGSRLTSKSLLRRDFHD